ncbi:fibronectin type III domain-containing protein [Tetraselmis virus 1]|uniref:Fibronectin type III domain-containing protein n=1 Tax=Tetraselmis virus 1 TaxID=2060617 RepID=A0A2P0VNM4_9VIRU|nr:fibronectin type III domain-containing protein [Tetraselmis virus 1]AUF82503.1 fibronectin type III domain-containing protein [Tetraselmis virus 1]
MTNLPSLSNNNYYDGSSVISGDDVISMLTIIDNNFKINNIVTNIVTINDKTAPVFTTVPFINVNTESGFTVNWELSDEGDTNQSFDTPLYIGVYTNNTIPPTNEQVIAGTGNDFLQKIDITDAKTTTNYVFTTLDPNTQYYVYILAQDNEGNQTSLYSSEPSTIDISVPTGLGSVSLSAGSNPESQVNVTGLQSVTDNDSLSSLTVKYGTVNNPSDGGTVSVPVTLSSGSAASDTQVVSGLSLLTQYYFWVRATDPSSNDTGDVATSPASITTLDQTAPTGLNSVTISAGGTPASQVLVSGLQSITDNDQISTLTIKYGTVNDPNNGGTVSVPVTLSSGSAASNTQTISGLSGNTQYYFWIQAVDPSSNDSGNIATSPVSITTASSGVVVPSGWTSDGSGGAFRIRSIPDGNSTITESGINSSYQFRVRYTATRDGSSGSYTFSGPGINVNSGGETTSNANVQGSYVTGQTSYSYSSFVNDFVAQARFEITT